VRSVVAVAVGIAALLAALPGCGATQVAAAPKGLPRYDHIVVAVFENHRQAQIIGSRRAPYLTALARQGANFTRSYAIQHPSQPNYVELFSGADRGITTDSCPHATGSDNIAHQLIRSGRTFTGYSERLPSAGSKVCRQGRYARRHAPWTDFTDLHQSVVGKPYAAFPADFGRLPTLSWVIPDLCHDMHDCSVPTGDRWARSHLDRYAQWAKRHNSLLIVTFDEDDRSAGNRIPTFFVGAHIRRGSYSGRIDHYTVLRTVEAIYRLPALGHARDRSPIRAAFTS
jgi:hypothetical protein